MVEFERLGRRVSLILLFALDGWFQPSCQNFVFADWTPLQTQLMQRYAKTQRPSRQGETVVVEVSAEFRELTLDERHGIVTVGFVCNARWTDYRLSWGAIGNQQFQNIPSTYFFAEEIWKPDLILFSNFTRTAANIGAPKKKGLLMSQTTGQLVKVYQNGTCRVSVAASASFPCVATLDYVAWPYDNQTCKINLASWVHEGHEIQFKIDGPEEIPNLRGKKFGVWEVTEGRQRAQLSHETLGLQLPEIEYEIQMRRLWSTEYSTTLLTPTFVVLVLSLANFIGWMNDPQEHASAAMGVAVLNIVLTMSVLSYYRHSMPMYKGMPNSLKFVTGLLVFQPIFMAAIRLDKIIGDLGSRFLTAPDWLQSALVQRICCLSTPDSTVSEVVSGMVAADHGDLNDEYHGEGSSTQLEKTSKTSHVDMECGFWAAEIFRRVLFIICLFLGVISYLALVV